MELVWYLGVRFTCAVYSSTADPEKTCILIGDLLDHCIRYESLNSLYRNNSLGWFFGVYKCKLILQNDSCFTVTRNNVSDSLFKEALYYNTTVLLKAFAGNLTDHTYCGLSQFQERFLPTKEFFKMKSKES